MAGRMVKWVVELSEFDIHFEAWGSPKGQILVDFIAELSLHQTPPTKDFS